jgi:hypothetical protein
MPRSRLLYRSKLEREANSSRSCTASSQHLSRPRISRGGPRFLGSSFRSIEVLICWTASSIKQRAKWQVMKSAHFSLGPHCSSILSKTSRGSCSRWVGGSAEAMGRFSAGKEAQKTGEAVHQQPSHFRCINGPGNSVEYLLYTQATHTDLNCWLLSTHHHV